jgi:arylsulfatase A
MKNYFILFCVIMILSFQTFGKKSSISKKPNVIVFFADDLGYGDLGCFGHPTIKTPNLDAMAKEGIRFTSFYSASSVCTPARAALLTGRYPIRSGMTSVVNAKSRNGLPSEEITIAELLKEVGYKTGIIGKWHLGHREKYLPINQGFDYYFGIPYSNDNNDTAAPYNKGNLNQAGPLPLIRNKEVIETGMPMNTITKRYTQEAKDFILSTDNDPFFLYLAYTMPHVPIDASSNFKGKSKAGLYGDVIEELDWSVGEILQLLIKKGISENTLVIFTSDNGPINNEKSFDAIGYDPKLIKPWHGGSAGLLNGGKYTVYEGGFRVPAIIKWNNNIEGNQINTDIVTTMDIFTTIAQLSGATIPDDRVYDGNDLTEMLLEGKSSTTQQFLYYKRDLLSAVRFGDWKYIYSNHNIPGVAPVEPIDELYNLKNDLEERYNVASVQQKKVMEFKNFLNKTNKEIRK